VFLDFIRTRLAREAVRLRLPTMHPEDTTLRSNVTYIRLEVMQAILQGTYGPDRAHTCHQLRMRIQSCAPGRARAASSVLLGSSKTSARCYHRALVPHLQHACKRLLWCAMASWGPRRPMQTGSAAANRLR